MTRRKLQHSEEAAKQKPSRRKGIRKELMKFGDAVPKMVKDRKGGKHILTDNDSSGVVVKPDEHYAAVERANTLPSIPTQQVQEAIIQHMDEIVTADTCPIDVKPQEKAKEVEEKHIGKTG